MKSQLHHVALNVSDLDWYARFFQEIFGMEIRRSTGAAPNRKLWFTEGIQLNESSNVPSGGGACDHISIAVPDVPAAKEAALQAGCTPLPNGAHWFALPNGTKVELMCMEPPALYSRHS